MIQFFKILIATLTATMFVMFQLFNYISKLLLEAAAGGECIKNQKKLTSENASDSLIGDSTTISTYGSGESSSSDAVNAKRGNKPGILYFLIV